MNNSGNEVGQEGKRRRSLRVNRIEWLFETREGKDAYSSMLLAIESRVSCVAAAGMIGVHPSTLTKWIARGKVEEEGYYRELFDGVYFATLQCSCICGS